MPYVVNIHAEFYVNMWLNITQTVQIATAHE